MGSRDYSGVKLMMNDEIGFIARMWLYLRTGYAIYLVLPIGLVSNGALLYYNYLLNNPQLSALFPTFEVFMTTGFVAVISAGIIAGALHYLVFYKHEQRTAAKNSEFMIDSSALYSATIKIAEKVGAGDCPEIEKLRVLRGELEK